MQPIYRDGEKGPIELFDEERLKELLDQKEKEVAEVRVFRLKEGMSIEIGGSTYKVVRARPDGKIVLKERR